jgi:hypothetical protein
MRNRDRAFNALAALGLNGANKQVAAHWLSRWQDDEPPLLEDFGLRDIWEFNPAIAIFEIRKSESILCVSAGSFHRLALGYDMKGEDLLSLTAAAEREARLAWCWEIVTGAVTVSYRPYKSRSNPKATAQCMSLPFCDTGRDGERCFLMHTNWRPEGSDWVAGNVQADARTPPNGLSWPSASLRRASPHSSAYGRPARHRH